MKKRLARIKALELAIDMIHDRAVALHNRKARSTRQKGRDEERGNHMVAHALLDLMEQLERKLQRIDRDVEGEA